MKDHVEYRVPQLFSEFAAAKSKGAAAGVAFDPVAVHYAVGDIHGMRAELDRLLVLIEEDVEAQNGAKTVVFLGDFVNRGPSSRQVLERLIEGPRRQNHRWIYLRGNHDQIFLDAISGKSEEAFAELMRKGGAETLASYGLRRREASLASARRAVPGEHLRFLESLPFFYASGKYFFVHAGVDPDRPLSGQCEKTMLTIRRAFLRKAHRLSCTVVHGHVPNAKGPVVAPGRIGIDTGAHASGILTAVVLRDEARPSFLSTAGRHRRDKRTKISALSDPIDRIVAVSRAKREK